MAKWRHQITPHGPGFHVADEGDFHLYACAPFGSEGNADWRVSLGQTVFDSGSCATLEEAKQRAEEVAETSHS